MRKYVKPRMLDDWDENRKVVINHVGDRFTAFKPEADRIYNASMRVYKRKK